MNLFRILPLMVVLLVTAACGGGSAAPTTTPPTAGAPTAVPPTVAPPTEVPPTAVALIAAPPTEAPSTEIPPTAATTSAPLSPSIDSIGTGTSIDLDVLFPLVVPEDALGREYALVECTGCHTIAPIAIGQKTAEGWRNLMAEHRRYVQATPEDVWELITVYLGNTFTPDRPVPELPEELLSGFTDY